MSDNSTYLTLSNMRNHIDKYVVNLIFNCVKLNRINFRLCPDRFLGKTIYHSIRLDELLTKIEIPTFANA